MPVGEIKVSFAAIEAAGENLKAKLSPLREAYEGEARDAWDRLQQDWNNKQDELNQVLSAIGTAVAQAAQDYQGTENQVKGMWG
ncbi:WXG100 family type VII secretion target [Kibdelosporangium lantanae]|uniref:WXG100 family type VII secretion target n=1 Tax=Kibdelosporangium lantanae TaxID=1497396 RepID=A0ABW3M905_9PSEU